MSTFILPSLAGLGFDVVRTPVWDTTVQQAINGKETRIAKQTYPRWKWQLTYNVLRSGATYGELQELAGFFNARQGMFDTFLYQDADDQSVAGQDIGAGDGATTSFQLVRAFGGFIEPMLAPNVVSNVYLNGAAIPEAGYSAPATPTLGGISGGSLAAVTYYVKITWVTDSGETLPSAEVSLAVLANYLLTVTQPASVPSGAVYWNIYVSNSSVGGSGHEQLQVTLPIGNTLWTEPASGLTTGASAPVANTTGWSFSAWGSSSPGSLTFAGAVANGVLITADFSYYFPVRMNDDNLSFTLFMSQLYKAKSFSFISVKN